MYKPIPFAQLEKTEPHLARRLTSMTRVSTAVLTSAVQPNGAMLAAVQEGTGPHTAVDYGYMWLRDAAENLRAIYALALPNANTIRSGIINWVNEVLLSDITGPGDPKVSHKRQLVLSGAHDESYYNPKKYNPPEWQPDNNALLVGAIIDTGPVDENAFMAIRSLCNGLVGLWDEENSCFIGNIENQWENHIVQGRHFTHTLLSVAYALDKAGNLSFENVPKYSSDAADWLHVSKRLYALFAAEHSYESEDSAAPYLRLLRAPGAENEYNPLDSGVTLVLPFRLPADASDNMRLRSRNTIRAMSPLILRDRPKNFSMGIFRYLGDTYDGLYHADGREPGAGAWPLLLFSYIIALQHQGDNEEANTLFLEALRYLDNEYQENELADNLIPEQIFNNDPRQGKGVIPLVWAHAMFVRAAAQLGYI